jgi:glycolate oxidase iron-sulfur subunit
MLKQEVSVASGSEARAHADPHALEGGYPAGTSIPPTSHKTGSAAVLQSVAMLRGCVQHSLLSHVNSDTREVLIDAGCKLIDVEQQGCCGALHAHSGELDHALDLARRNIDAFEASGADIIVVNAAGCGAMMKEYGEQLARDPQYAERAHAFSARVRDINEYLIELDYHPPGTVAMRVTYDAPCHLHHAQRITKAPIELLQRVHGLTLVPLQRPEECCGGAGIYGITHPDIGGRIMKDKIDDVVASGANAVLTPNPGCMMQIGAGLILRGTAISALHPIEILAMSARSGRPKEQQ